MRRHRQRTVERVVEEAYWEGFFGCLENGSSTRSLSFTSMSGVADLNEAADIAYEAGFAYCEEVLAERERRRDRERNRGLPWFTVSRKVPGRVMADAYGAARVT